MLTTRTHGNTTRLIRLPAFTLRRGYAAKSTGKFAQPKTKTRAHRENKRGLPSRKELHHIDTPLAQQLKDTKLWDWGTPGRKRPTADMRRVNIVSEQLCDDALNYIKPTLERHVGCDIIDLFPGSGVWSSKLHDVLQPRSHILLEPDEPFYRPFLEPLLNKPGITMIPKSGISWQHLEKVLSPEHLPHQTEQIDFTKSAPQRNDTLLVTANLGFFPKRKFAGFESVSQLVMYQFIHAIRATQLFQRYGLVRMLIWCVDDEKNIIIPRLIQQRRRMAVDTELSTDWAAEIVGNDDPAHSPTIKAQWYRRDRAIDLESARDTLRRMRATGYNLVPGRETKLIQEVLEMGEDNVPSAGSKSAWQERDFRAELEDLTARQNRGEIEEGTPEWRRAKLLRSRTRFIDKSNDLVNDLMIKRAALLEMYAKATDDAGRARAQAADIAWNHEVSLLNHDRRNDFSLTRDSLHVFRQDPSVLMWDRRYVEPLAVRPTEFFPNVPLALIDIQPRAMHPLLHHHTPQLDPRLAKVLADKGGPELIDKITKTLVGSTGSMHSVLEGMAPGLSAALRPHLKSLFDPAAGGSPISGYGEVGCRCINERQLIELLEQYLMSPHTPVLSELFYGEPQLSDYNEEVEEAQVTQNEWEAFKKKSESSAFA